MRRGIAGVLLALAVLSAPATGRAGAFQIDCGEDGRRLCPAQTGGGLLACLLRQKPDVSAGCWTLIGVLEPCASDIERRCFSAEPGGGHILQCLESQRRDLSNPCQQALDQAEQEAKNRGYTPPH